MGERQIAPLKPDPLHFVQQPRHAAVAVNLQWISRLGQILGAFDSSDHVFSDSLAER